MQRTLKSALVFDGIGLHTGAPVRMVLRPASAQHGIWFRRSDLGTSTGLIAARWDTVVPSELCTKIANETGASVMTIEHVMAAISGTGLTNVLVDIDGPEVPAADGSAAPFVKAILETGLIAQDVPQIAIQILKTVKVERDGAVARLDPAITLEMDFEIDFDEAAIGHQRKSLNLANGAFVRELCDSRTFCRVSDVDAMQAKGLALGGMPGENAVVFDGETVASPGGLRHADEPVRHKMLDALGDLALAGAPILGRYTGNRAGHSLTNALLHALYADPTAYQMVPCTPGVAARLPGVGLRRSDAPIAA